jgi:hypothetical protein
MVALETHQIPLQVKEIMAVLEDLLLVAAVEGLVQQEVLEAEATAATVAMVQPHQLQELL